MENASPVSDGKAFQESAEAAFDSIAQEHGIDDNGDDIPVDDDEPALEATEAVDETETPVAEDEPAIEEPAEPEVEAAPVETETESHDVDLAPTTWPSEWKDNFNKLPAQARKDMLEMNRKMNQGFTRKMMDLAEKSKGLEAIRHTIEPHQERLSRAGISPDVAIQRSLAWDAHIQKDPVQGIKDMAAAYGVDLSQATTTNEQQYLTPTERALQQQAEQANQSVTQIQQQMQHWQQMQEEQTWQQRQSNAHQMLDEFMNATDDKGNRLHPYIEHCAPKMTHYIQTGAAGNLDEAYQMAIAMTPEIQAAREAQRKTDQVKASQRKAEKVRKASGGIVDKSSGKSKPRMTDEQRVAAAYDKIVNA